MFIPFFSTALLILFSSPIVRAGFSVQTPTFTQCAPVTLSWDNTTGPYDILIANQSNQCGYAVADPGQFTNNSATWIVALPANWTVQITVEDSLSDDAWSQPIVVQPSGNVSCLPANLAALPNAHAVPSSTHSATGRASSRPLKNGDVSAPFTHQMPLCAVLLSTIGVITYTFFAL